MHRLRTKLSLVLGTAVAMVAVLAPSAGAAPPDFPHEPDAGKWSGVRVYSWGYGGAATAVPCGEQGVKCAFSDTAFRRQHVEAFGMKVTSEKDCTVAGEFVGPFGELDYTSSTCGLFDTPVQKAVMCEHKYTGELWMRTPITIGNNETRAWGHLNVTPSGLKTQVPTSYLRGVTFGSPTEGIFTSFNNGPGEQTPAFLSVGFNEMWPQYSMPLIGKDTTVPCAWPELA